MQYVNRLSDAIYALARLEETDTEYKKLRETVETVVRKTMEASQKTSHNKPFTLETIKSLAEFAEEKANEMKVPMVFSAVDEGGNLLLLHRMEGSLLISVEVSMNKAYTANALKMPTEQLADLIAPGGEFYGLQNLESGRIVAFGGGIPYEIKGQVVGAIGVSGGSAEEDMLIAQFALRQVLGGQ